MTQQYNSENSKRLKKNLRLFPYLTGDKNKASQLQIDDESLSYISVREFADKITNIIVEHLTKMGMDLDEVYITDATAGVGGNTISFAKKFKNVTAIEIDKKRFDYLKNNLSIYNLNYVKTVHDNCLNVIDQLDHQDVVFIDPPWGGKSYKKHKSLRLSLSITDNHNPPPCSELDQKKEEQLVQEHEEQMKQTEQEAQEGDNEQIKDIETVCNDLFNKEKTISPPKLVVFKLPQNYDLHHFFKVVTNKKIMHYKLLDKMMILAVYE